MSEQIWKCVFLIHKFLAYKSSKLKNKYVWSTFRVLVCVHVCMNVYVYLCVLFSNTHSILSDDLKFCFANVIIITTKDFNFPSVFNWQFNGLLFEIIWLYLAQNVCWTMLSAVTRITKTKWGKLIWFEQYLINERISKNKKQTIKWP